MVSVIGINRKSTMNNRILTKEEITKTASTVSSNFKEKSFVPNMMNNFAAKGALEATLTPIYARLPLASIGLMAQKYVFLFSLILLYGCGINSDNNSIVDRTYIKNMKVGELVKLRDITQSDWNIVCLLTPYSGGVIDSEDERIHRMDRRIPELNLTISEAGWHLIFEKEGVVAASSIQPTSKTEMHLIDTNFTTEIMEELSKQSFIPEFCAEFDQAALYKRAVSIKVGGKHLYYSNQIIFGAIQE
jgi:hypothetical protein